MPPRREFALATIGQLYAVEREIGERLQTDWRELPREERLARIQEARQARAGPLVERYFQWLDEQAPQLVPKNPVRQAIEYSRNQSAALRRCLADGRLSIDNGAAERAIRGIALGRRNWLFCGSERGARAACVYFTLCASCKRNGVDPFAYLRDVFKRLPALNAAAANLPSRRPTVDQLRALLPDQWKPSQPPAPAPSTAPAPGSVAPPALDD